MEKEKRPWVKDFYKTIGHALFLAKQENDTSLRLGYILLDHGVEHFLKSYLRIKTRMSLKKFNEKIDIFYNLISMAKENIENSNDILDRILEYHNTRNNLYHSSVYLSISKERFLDYRNDIFSLCRLMQFDNVSDIANEECNKIIQNVLNEKSEKRWECLKRVSDLIKNNFDIPPEICQDIVLASVPGSTDGAIRGINTLLLGMISEDNFIGKECAYDNKLNGKYVYDHKFNGKRVRILEIIEGYESTTVYYTFFISSIKDPFIWYCFYRCFLFIRSDCRVSRNKKIQEIQEFAKQNKDKIDYKIDYITQDKFSDAFNLI